MKVWTQLVLIFIVFSTLLTGCLTGPDDDDATGETSGWEVTSNGETQITYRLIVDGVKTTTSLITAEKLFQLSFDADENNHDLGKIFIQVYPPGELNPSGDLTISRTFPEGRVIEYFWEYTMDNARLKIIFEKTLLRAKEIVADRDLENLHSAAQVFIDRTDENTHTVKAMSYPFSPF